MSHEPSNVPDAITMSAILLLKSRLRTNSEIAAALNQNIPAVGRTIEVTAEYPFEAGDISRVWEYMCCHHGAFVRLREDWGGDELVTCGVNFIVDGSLKHAEIPTVRLEEMPRAICDYAAGSLGDDDSDPEAEEVLLRWNWRASVNGW